MLQVCAVLTLRRKWYMKLLKPHVPGVSMDSYICEAAVRDLFGSVGQVDSDSCGIDMKLHRIVR